MLSSPVEEIKNRLDIVEVISQYIRLQKAGANFRAPCPFHAENKPSFFVSPARQIWHCFGCSKGGDIFGFVKEIEGVEFGDALRILAQKAGVELKQQDPKLITERQRLYELCELAARFFEKQLSSTKTGLEAKEYLLGRGIAEESLKKWRIGYAPDTWQGLSDFLVGRGYKREEAERAGLALKNKDGNFYDRFRGRIIFPVFDLNSQVVGFGGRVFKTEDPAKYINSPATLLYDKSRILYGLDRSRVEIRKKGFCVLVEGYVDAIMCSQAGVENVVATSGTALTTFQLRVLKRYSENLFTAFDMDTAGDSATKRGIDLAQAQGFNIKVITMPQGQDPADVVAKSPQDWEKLVGEAKSILEFYFETTLARFDGKTPEGKRDISKTLIPVIKRIPNRIEQFHWIQLLAKNLGTKEEIIEEELRKISLPNTEEANGPEEAPVNNSVSSKKPRKESLEERIISLILKTPQGLEFIDEKLLPCFSPKIQTILSGFRKNPTDFYNSSPEHADFLNYLSLLAEVEYEDAIDFEKEIQTCLREILCLETKKQLNKISLDIKKAEEGKDQEKLDDLIGQFNTLAQQLNN